ncbi:hypothetical protein NOK75_25435 [Vibrio parahaemolyticus]|uniref:hypothetical protein n=1 Tax=Vibrio parahaemolyticus TaxID=670 RepID=UPI001A2DE91B|nr:hypothetical protein [Vibrio parahaemolyticus]MCX8774020.1 hypothetical protein [Vibrio parahaemolyticus]MCX8794018.1 hypothetical protein [Vibrio parahaemolyticus]MCX8814293.1 hypothetical protein [Vibrio parahaemolyticus]MCX8845207.1 hypothetical protein [Vibrio parahaemolyticus]MCX8855128.1 hypothetical protein [Vibrio parahaemolyticus]
MQSENRYYRGPGYHVDHVVAEEFADKYLSDNGELINTDSGSFESDLKHFLDSHNMVEQAYRTINTSKIFEELRDNEGVF